MLRRALRYFGVLAVSGGLLTAIACSRATTEVPLDDTTPLPVSTSASGLRFDPAAIDSAYIMQDVLHVVTRYGGGCRTHRFAMVSSMAFLESYPVQLPLALGHDAQGDLCRAIKGSLERFDLSSIRRAYLASYGQGGPIILQVREPGEGGKTVSVRYEVR